MMMTDTWNDFKVKLLGAARHIQDLLPVATKLAKKSETEIEIRAILAKNELTLPLCCVTWELDRKRKEERVAVSHMNFVSPFANYSARNLIDYQDKIQSCTTTEDLLEADPNLRDLLGDMLLNSTLGDLMLKEGMLPRHASLRYMGELLKGLSREVVQHLSDLIPVPTRDELVYVGEIGVIYKDVDAAEKRVKFQGQLIFPEIQLYAGATTICGIELEDDIDDNGFYKKTTDLNITFTTRQFNCKWNFTKDEIMNIKTSEGLLEYPAISDAISRAILGV